MRKLRIVCAVCLALLAAFAAAGVRADGTWYLRVVARDDTPEAQAEKLRVRDAVIGACPLRPQEMGSALERIRKAADEAAPCRVSLRLWTPGKGVPPAPTLYVTIGRGQGHNWWGVLYEDSLLLAQAEGSPENGGEVEFVFPLWTWLRGLLGL